MITINFIAAGAQPIRAEGKIGQSVMEAAVAAGVSGIAADCGGMLTCATCHVMVEEPVATLLPPADGEERAMLAFTAMPATSASRLSCQIILKPELDGLTVELPASQY
ncbi:MAG: 2Fe-2S iron-sulfur cluster-binding protein [Polaromonas sp.]|nr:2Fe-2S iron-sulfur cluster-binding protein [Polaromonas sp.]